MSTHAGEARETVIALAMTDAESATEFVNGNKLPLSLEFNSDNSERIFKSGIDKHVGGTNRRRRGGAACALPSSLF